MSRGKKGASQHQVTVYFSPEMMIAIDNHMVGMGLESRSVTVSVLAHAGLSALPLEAAIGETMTQSLRSLKRGEFQALADYYLQRAEILQAALR